MNRPTTPPPTTAAMFRLTLLAMLPALLAAAATYGVGVLLRAALAAAAALAAEAICLRLRRKPLDATAAGGALIAATIIAIAVPPLSPWYVAVFAAAAAIALAKHAYGGTGNNPFNPAMAGYALAFIAFPADFAAWHAGGETATSGASAGGAATTDFRAAWQTLFADGVASPTPLIAARIGETATLAAPPLLPLLAAAAGGIFLLAMRAADFRLPLSFALGAAAATWLGGGSWLSLLHGGMVFAAFFVVTDPVTAAATPAGRYLYGGAIGALAAALRAHGAHADAIAFAVLAGNTIAPLCDIAAQKFAAPRNLPRSKK